MNKGESSSMCLIFSSLAEYPCGAKRKTERFKPNSREDKVNEAKYLKPLQRTVELSLKCLSGYSMRRCENVREYISAETVPPENYPQNMQKRKINFVEGAMEFFLFSKYSFDFGAD